ncbi:MFS transporter [Micrococcaceae bacterium Sec5.1]
MTKQMTKDLDRRIDDVSTGDTPTHDRSGTTELFAGARDTEPEDLATVTFGEYEPARRALVPVLAFSGIAIAAMQTLTVPIIADPPRLLNATASDSAWVVTSTLLAGTVAAAVLGKLGDMYGRRKLFLIALGLMVAGSLISGFNSDLVPMIIGRAVQGVALGAIPLGIGIIWEQVPPDRRSTAIAVMSGSIGVGGALAIPIAALVA